MKRRAGLIFAYFSYVVFLFSFVYLILFSGDLLVPKSIDRGRSLTGLAAILVDLGSLSLFGLQHSGMARPGFKQWWQSIFPKGLQRSAYVLAASLTLLLVMAAWQPVPEVLWSVQAPWVRRINWGLFILGWLTVFVSAQLISSRHLFGLQQAKEFSQNKTISAPEFQTPSLYRRVRHPMMLGFLIGFWAAPTMTVGRLLFASGMSIYILIGLQLEERDLAAKLGKAYRRYRKQVPMLVPLPGRSWTPTDSSSSSSG